MLTEEELYDFMQYRPTWQSNESYDQDGDEDHIQYRAWNRNLKGPFLMWYEDRAGRTSWRERVVGEFGKTTEVQ